VLPLGRTLWPVQLENLAAEKKKKVPLGIFLLFDVIWTTEYNFLCLCVGQSSKLLGFAYL
jgi:hypothetical protein